MLASVPLPAAASLAQARENYRSAGARLRTAQSRYAAGRIKKTTLERHQREYDEAARVLQELEGGASSPNKQSDPSPSTNQNAPESTSKSTPSSGRTVTVSNSSELKSALANASPGIHIVLRNGTYSGNFSLTKSGNAKNPIVIKAASKHGATLTGLLQVDGNHCWVSELTFKPGYMVVKGSDTKILRCRFLNVRANSITVFPPSQRAEIGYNEFRNFGGTGADTGSGRGVSVRPNASSRWSARTHIHHNYFRDQNGNGGVIGIGIAQKNSATAVNALVEWNLIENAKGQAVYLKSSENTVRFNTVRQLNSNERSGFQARHGLRNEFIANASLNAGGVLLRGKQHRAIGNYRDNKASGLWADHGAASGTVTQDRFMSVTKAETEWPAGEECVFIGNIGSLTIGGGSGSHKIAAKGNVIEAHSGSVRLNGSQQVGTRDNRNKSASAGVPKYRILSPQDVGPNA